jgi:hypothetical protein
MCLYAFVSLCLYMPICAGVHLYHVFLDFETFIGR